VHDAHHVIAAQTAVLECVASSFHGEVWVFTTRYHFLGFLIHLISWRGLGFYHPRYHFLAQPCNSQQRSRYKAHAQLQPDRTALATARDNFVLWF
jgi:hypothetical protein